MQGCRAPGGGGRAPPPWTSRARGADRGQGAGLARRCRGDARLAEWERERSHCQARVCRAERTSERRWRAAAAAPHGPTRAASGECGAPRRRVQTHRRGKRFLKKRRRGESAVPANVRFPLRRGDDGGPSAPPRLFSKTTSVLAPEQLRAAHLGGSGGPAGWKSARRRGARATTRRGSVAAAAEARSPTTSAACWRRRRLRCRGRRGCGRGRGRRHGVHGASGQSGDRRTSLNDKLGY